MQIGCSLPAKTFMPEYTKQDPTQTALQTLLYGSDVARANGYDYLEVSVGAIWDLDGDALSILAAKVRDGTFRLRACNSFIPPDLPICTASRSELETFVRGTMQKLDRLGVRAVIFGSGKARTAPEGMPKKTAEQRILDFLRLCSRIGKSYGVTTAIEPLNSTETNMICSVSDGVRYLDAIGEDNLRLQPDLFHMATEGEMPESLLSVRDRILHLHASEAPGRVFPGKFGGEYLKRCGQVLRAADWNGAVTVECVFDDFEKEAAASMQFMKEWFQ